MSPKAKRLQPVTKGLEPDLNLGNYVFSGRPVPLKTNHSSADLLSQPFVFSQTPPLDAEDFIKAASERRITLDPALLEDLHRNRLLVPLYRVRVDRPRPQSVIALAQEGSLHLDSRITLAATQGRLTDPTAERFLRWPRGQTHALNPALRGQHLPFIYFYSRYQLLALAQLADVLSRHAVVWRGRDNAKRLSPDYHKFDQAQEHMSEWRTLAVALQGIDSRYRPSLTRTISDYNAWREHTLTDQPSRLLAWLGITVTDVRKTADMLRDEGIHRDVLGDFYDLIRRAQPKSWESLKGEAAIAMDYRCAAELLDMFADELEGLPLTPAPEQGQWKAPPESQRLLQRGKSLDGVLTGLNLSPYPSLVVAVEGQTEEYLVPKIFEQLGYALDPSWIHIECFGGVQKDLILLARYVARPFLGQDHGEFVSLDRPMTRFLVLVDAEGKKGRRYITAADRANEQDTLLNAILDDIDPRYHRDLRRAEAKLITIRTWNKYPFEFANFTVPELADGLITLAGSLPPNGRTWLVKELENEKRRHRPKNGKSADIQRVWRAWQGHDLSKPGFGKVMWPFLEAKIAAALAAGHRNQPPVLKNVIEAVSLARLPHRMSMGLRSDP